MDFLGFSSEELESINSGTKKKTSEFSPAIEPIPDLSKYSESTRNKYMQAREAEISRLKHLHYNKNPSLNDNKKSQIILLPRLQKFIKKLKTIGEENKEELISELKELSLKKFITEVANSLSESRMQLKDLPAVIEVAGMLHQQYPEFQKGFESYLKKQHKEGDLPRKIKILRLATEMIAYGLWSDISGYIKVIKDYVRSY
jgi:hypothetical protein